MSHTINHKRSHDLERLYEINFQLLLKLVPHLREMKSTGVSTVLNAPDLHLRILERSPYTTVISLTHEFMAGPALLPAPDLWIRICHDACVAEAIANQDGHSPAHARTYTWHKGLDTNIKWQLNTFAEKWLKDCLKQGHQFKNSESYSKVLSV